MIKKNFIFKDTTEFINSFLYFGCFLYNILLKSIFLLKHNNFANLKYCLIKNTKLTKNWKFCTKQTKNFKITFKL